MDAKQPNIVYFVADQLRADALGHLGNPAAHTPCMDGLAAEGVSFENAYCQNPVCVPSRCSFLTGLYPHTTGHRTIHYLQNPGEPNFLRTMKNQGYEVAWIGRNDLIPADRPVDEFCDMRFNPIGEMKKVQRTLRASEGSEEGDPAATGPQEQGFYSFFKGKAPDGRSTPLVAHDWACIDRALAYLDEKASHPGDRPFFLYVTLIFPHPPYTCEDPWYSMIDRSKIPPRRPSALGLPGKPSMLREIAEKQGLHDWGEDRFRELRATYLAMAARFDHQLGMLVERLRERGLYDDTSLFVFSDHGDYTGDYDVVEKVQNCFEDPVVRVPLIIKPAARFTCKPRVSPALVELTDLTETVCAMTGVRTEYVQFGRSLLPVLAGSDEHREAVFSEGGRIHGERWAMELGHGPESPYWPRLSTQAEEGPQHTKACMVRVGNLKYVFRLYEQDELYDLAEDPLELENRIDDERYRDAVVDMKMRLLEHMVATGDIVPDRKDKR